MLLQAKSKGWLSSVRDVITELESVPFYISDELIAETLRQAGESDTG